jgi:hypothetical protein
MSPGGHMKCAICGKKGKGKHLCGYHSQLYMWDSEAQGYRLKKRNSGSRYTSEKYHKTEVLLTKIMEDLFGKGNVVTSYHPKWAIGFKHVLLEYDICVPHKRLLIEYNGEQHYKKSRFFHHTIKQFRDQKKRDKYKLKVAKLNGYKLITFKYDEPIFKDYVAAKINGKLN